MNKRIKRIIAITLTLTALSGISPIKNLSFVSTAYASSDEEEDEKEEKEAIENSYLDDLDLSEGDLNFSKKKTEYTVKVDSSDESVVITAKAKNKTDKITIDGSKVDLDGNNKADKKVELDKGRNLIKIKVESKDYGIRTYNLVINRGSASKSSSSESDDSDGVYLYTIALSDGNIAFSKEKMSYDVNVNSSIEEIRITAEPDEDKDTVKIGGISTDKDESFRRTVKLANGKNTVLINVEDDDGNEQTYTLNINRGGTTEGDTYEVDNTQDPIYLDDIVIEDGNIPLIFKPKVTNYAVDVKEDYDSILIKAKPQYDDVVRINGQTSTDTYRRRVELKKGKNEIKIKVNNSNTYDKSDDEFEERIYTLTVYRGSSEGTAQGSVKNNTVANNGSASNTGSNVPSNIKANQWVNTNGKWQYNDSQGNSLKSTWYYDRDYGRSYYFLQDGTMATGWISYNGNWYYLDDSGAMMTGWVNSNGKWYYLYDSGNMAVNTKIDGYKIGANGAML